MFKDEQLQALSDAYEALSGAKPLEALARVLREGWHTPDLLRAIAKRLDPIFEGQWDEHRLILVSRDTLRQINQPAREARLEMVSDIINTVWAARHSSEMKKNVVADLCAKWNVSKSTIYAITKGL